MIEIICFFYLSNKQIFSKLRSLNKLKLKFHFKTSTKYFLNKSISNSNFLKTKNQITSNHLNENIIKLPFKYNTFILKITNLKKSALFLCVFFKKFFFKDWEEIK